MFDHHSQLNNFPNYDISDSISYERQLQEMLAKLQDMAETNLVQADQYKKQGYECSTHTQTFEVNDPVWLLIPHQRKLFQMARKLDGKSPININIVNDKSHYKALHVN